MKMISRIKTVRHTLMGQILVVFVTVNFCVLLFGSVICTRVVENVLKSNQEKNTVQQIRQLEYDLQMFCSELEQSGRNLITNGLISGKKAEKLWENIDLTDIDDILQIRAIQDEFDLIINDYPYIHSVYFYADSGNTLGNDSKCVHVIRNNTKDENFYTSGLYDSVLHNFPKATWLGGNSQNDTDVDSKVKDDPDYMVSFGRAIKKVGREGFAGVFLINVNQKELVKYYENLFSEFENTVYITDKNGKILSSREKDYLGKQSDVFSFIPENGRYGTMLLKDNSVQGIYYKMNPVEWTVVVQIPTSEYNRDTRKITLAIVFIFLINFILMSSIALILIGKIMRPLNTLTEAMKDLGGGNIGKSIAAENRNEFDILVGQFNYMSKSISDLMKKKEEAEEEKRVQELLALQAQINPHFIYNTVNTIKWMAVIANAENIEKSCTVLGNLLRPVFKDTSSYYTIEKELEYLENYVTIMNYRYSNIIHLIFEVPQELLKCKILKFILQPMVENSIYHGMKEERVTHNIRIKMHQDEGNLVIQVEDDGKGISKEKLDQIEAQMNLPDVDEDGFFRGIGLGNCYKRVKLHFGEEYGITIKSEIDEGTLITVVVPVIM